jgi:hypothetical protein
VTDYIVREAILVKGAPGSRWRVTFTPADDQGDDVVVLIPPDKIDDMTFADKYSLAQIDALRDRPDADVD